MADELTARQRPGRRHFTLAVSGLSIVLLAMTLAGVVSADIGQAFGGATAVIAGTTLMVVLTSVVIQHQQLKEIQRDRHESLSEMLVMLALEHPRYRQCWGARVAPDGIDEGLFYYCSSILKSWARAWELHLIDERQAREYLRGFFASEIPRMFFEKHADWHRRGQSRTDRERFREFADEEYLRAIRAGPPLRGHER